MIQLIGFLVSITFILGLTLGLYVFSRNPRNPLFQAFGLTALGTAGWNLSIFLLIAGIGPALIPGKLAFSFGAILVTGFAFFTFVFLKLSSKHRWLYIFFGILGVIFTIIPLTPWYVSEVVVIDGYVTGDLNPFLTNLWGLNYLFTLFFSFGYFVFKLVKTSGVEKRRIRQLLLGFGLFLFPMFTTQFILPIVFQDYRWNNLGPVFTIFLLVFLANAVLRYRLLDLKWIVGKSIFISAIISLVLWVIIAVNFLLADLVGTTVALCTGALFVVVIFKPLWAFLEKVFDSLIDFGGYDAKKATEEVFNIVRSHGELEDLMPRLAEKFEKYFALQQIAFFIVSENGGHIVGDHISGFRTSIKKKAKDLLTLSREADFAILEHEEMEWTQQFSTNKKRISREKKWLQVFHESEIETLIPLVVEDVLVGVMVFGKRRFEAAMHSRDINFLNLIRAGISPAFENAAKFAQIKELYEQLKEVDKAKTEFISIVSHRFRTPLSAIRWNVETVMELPMCKKSDECSQALGDAYDRTLFLNETLDRLFDSLAIESGKLKLKKEVISSQELFSEVASQFKNQCSMKKLNCTTAISNFSLDCDKDRVRSACKSLLTNAIQYTPQSGKVSLRVSKEGNNAKIVVADSGIGIPGNVRNKIFEKFFRAQNAIHTFTDGQGLGLYLVKKVVDLHHGKISFVSKTDKGTTFTVLIPLSKAKKSKK